MDDSHSCPVLVKVEQDRQRHEPILRGVLLVDCTLQNYGAVGLAFKRIDHAIGRKMHLVHPLAEKPLQVLKSVLPGDRGLDEVFGGHLHKTLSRGRSSSVTID